jgi:hypothetical protein
VTIPTGERATAQRLAEKVRHKSLRRKRWNAGSQQEQRFTT